MKVLLSGAQINDIYVRLDRKAKDQRQQLSEALISTTPTELMALMWLYDQTQLSEIQMGQFIWPNTEWDAANPSHRETLTVRLSAMKETLQQLAWEAINND